MRRRFQFDEKLKRVVEIVPDRPAPCAAPTIGAQWRNFTSASAAVHPSQVQEHREFIREYGLVGVGVRDDGGVEFRGRAARKAYNRARGFRDNDGGYGD